MSPAPKTLKNDAFPMKFIYITVAAAAVFPEYIAPIFTLACFLVFKKHFSLTSQKVKMGEVGKVFLLFMCYSFISSFWSSTPIFSGAVSLLWMGMLLGSFFISNMATTRDRFESLVVCFSVGGGIVGGIGLLQYILLLAGIDVPNPLWSVLDGVIYKIMPFEITETANVWESSRAASTFDNPLVCATYLIMAFPLAVYGFTSGKKENRTVCGISALLILGGIIGTTSRGAAVAVIASLVVLVFINSRKMLSVLATLAAAVVAFAAVIIKRDSLFEMDLEYSNDSRIRIWKACIELIKNKPIFGYGAGNQTTASGLEGYGIIKPHAHSLYFEITAELGIVGLIFLAVVFIFIMRDIIKLIKTGGIYRRMGIAFLSVEVGFLVASVTEFTMQTPKELQYFMLVLGMLEAAKRLALKETKDCNVSESSKISA